MAKAQRQIKRGVLMALIAIMSLAGGVAYLTSGGEATAQAPEDIVQVTSEDGGYSAPALLEVDVAGASRLLLAYGSVSDEDTGLFVKTSEDGGTTWSEPALVANGEYTTVPGLAQEADGTVWLVYARGQWRSYYRTSGDGGTTWSEESRLPFHPDDDDNQIYPVVTVTDNGRVIVAWRTRWGARTISYAYSDDGGAIWVGPLVLTDPDVVELGGTLPGIAVDSSGAVWVVWGGDAGEGRGIHYQVSEDDGVTWSAPVLLWHVDGFVGPSIARTVNGLVLSWWEHDECFDEPLGACTSNIWYSTSADNGATWSERVKYTEFKGDDWFPSVAALQGGGFALTWASRRRQSDSDYSEEETIWFGNPAMHQDDAAPPAVLRGEHFPVPNPQVGDEVRVLARVAGGTAGMITTTVQWSANGAPREDVEMSGADDGLVVAELGPFERPGIEVEYRVRVEDESGNAMTSFESGFRVQPRFVKRNHVLLVVDHTDEGAMIEFAPFYRDALDALGTGHDLWDSSLRGPPMAEDLLPYRHGAVVWTTPYYDSWLWQGPMPDRAVEGLTAYLEHGGSMFVSSQELSQHFDGEAWLPSLLGVEHVDCCSPNEVEGVAVDLIGHGLAFGLEGGDGADNSCCADEIRPAMGAVPVLRYLGEGIDEDGVAAVRFRRGSSKVVYFGFSFEAIDNQEARREVMARVMDWINPTCNGRPSTIDGTPGNDTIIGTAHDDVIVSFGGRDRIWGLEGDDTICGGSGKDVIFGGEGNDWIGGLGGADRINAGPGRDVIKGGRGEDLIIGGDGDNVIEGGSKDDQVSGGDGDDFIDGGFGDDILLGNGGEDIIEGGPGVDAIDCGDGADIADGGHGRDAPPIDCELQASIP